MGFNGNAADLCHHLVGPKTFERYEKKPGPRRQHHQEWKHGAWSRGVVARSAVEPKVGAMSLSSRSTGRT